VQTIDPGGPKRWLLRTAAGDELAADVVVNAAGPWSSQINAIAGIGHDFSVTSRPLRVEVHEVPSPNGFEGGDGSLGIAIADPDLGIYVRTVGNGNLLVGGMEPECDPLEWLDDPDAAAPQPTVPVFESQVLRAARRFPGLAVPNRPSGVAGVYDATTDWTPIYDRTAADGYYVAMGTSGNQFKNAPVVGQLMSRLISEVEAGRDHDRDPVVFTLPRTGHAVDLSAYSRLRPVDTDAPANVMG
jgi:glycine/D-amino acid oxidase-like deaminating enzyme